MWNIEASLILVIVVVGVFDTFGGCHFDSSNIPEGTLFGLAPLGSAAYALSLATNLLATLLVAFKAWSVFQLTSVLLNANYQLNLFRQLRRHLREYVVAKVGAPGARRDAGAAPDGRAAERDVVALAQAPPLQLALPLLKELEVPPALAHLRVEGR